MQSAVSKVQHARERAEQTTALNAWAELAWDEALSLAQSLDQAQAQGLRGAQAPGPLAGWLVNIKDLFQVRGMGLRASTHAAMPGEVTQWEGDAPAVARLRAAGAIIIGKTHMHEIALGATGENSWTGDVINPLNAAWQAGGSSSGAAVAVASGVTELGLGSDTGGSIRIPANFCGVVGFKPSFGAVPLQGALPLSWSFDHAGPITQTVAQARAAFEVLAARDTHHARVARKPRFALPLSWLKGRMDAQVAQRFDEVIAQLRAAGAQVIEVQAPMLQEAWECYTPIVRAQAAYIHRAVLAQVPADGSMALEEASRLTGFSKAVLAPMLDGRMISAQHYLAAEQLRRKVRTELRQLLQGFDAMLLPTSAIVPPNRGQTEVMIGGQTRAVRELVLGQTLPFNVAGVPAITLPVGGRAAASVPIGLQIAGRFDGDASLLGLAQWAEGVLNV